VVWNAWAPALWRRMRIAADRQLRRLGRAYSVKLRLSYAKVAEYQARGLIHFYALVRLNAFDPEHPDIPLPPPAGITAAHLDQALTHAVATTRFTTPPHATNPDGWTLTWGPQLDIRPVTLSPTPRWPVTWPNTPPKPPKSPATPPDDSPPTPSASTPPKLAMPDALYAATRPIPLTDWLVDLLIDRRKRMAALHDIAPEHLTGWVFPNTHGGLREAANMRRDWRAFRNRHDLGDWFTPYTLRRTVATLLTDKLSAREVSDLLGHSRISQTTDTYVGRKIVSRTPPLSSTHSGTPKTEVLRNLTPILQGHRGRNVVCAARDSNPEPAD